MTKPISIQTPNHQQPSIRLVFEKTDDRWKHSWIARTGPTEQMILTSVEGTPEQNWPPSPPLQDINQHSLDSGDAVLGVGMAGKSHWSASYTVESDTDSPQLVSIKSDLACLQNRASHQSMIGSEYEIDSAWEVKSANECRMELTTASGHAVILKAFSSDACQTIFDFNDSTLIIRPASLSNQPKVATRWGFELSMVPERV